MEALLLARIQFAANITFHILFPSITIALGWLLLFFKLRHNKTGDARWKRLYGFWVKVFALSFAMGVVSGIVMSFQFGTNWPGFMEKVGNIAGPLLAYEVLTAFFMEATFLGIMLYGQGRVSNRIHTLATLLVCIGTSLSAFWIIALNSWMHTPAGFEMREGVAHAVDWWAIVFNPSMPYRMVHMLLASGLTVAFLVAGLSAFRLLSGAQTDDARLGLKVGVTLAALLIPLQIVVGDLHGLNTLKHQPAKVAAMEGLWETTEGAPLLLFALPNQTERRNHFELAVPNLASLILTHDLHGEVKGLNDFEGAHPRVAPVFWSFRVMVGMGLLMLTASWLSAALVWRRGELPRLLLRGLVGMSLSGWVAIVAGWYTTEMGRQPWLVQGVLRTAEAAAPNVGEGLIWTSLAVYLALYATLTVAYVLVLFHMAHKQDADGPKPSPMIHTLEEQAQ
ncbi:cytochrome ubiquinol oxidase subunit I [Polycyclovorans algicola]|uniref:cytochrome ubiquinol oxidase subunit I n=1 Tax=Polycyclovorans algicola TaxID=616992 RepID=UPI000A034BD6